MPLNTGLAKKLESSIADMKNYAGEPDLGKLHALRDIHVCLRDDRARAAWIHATTRHLQLCTPVGNNSYRQWQTLMGSLLFKAVQLKFAGSAKG